MQSFQNEIMNSYMLIKTLKNPRGLCSFADKNVHLPNNAVHLPMNIFLLDLKRYKYAKSYYFSDRICNIQWAK